MKNDPEQKRQTKEEKLMDCWDEVSEHCRAAETLAGLLAMAGDEMMEASLVRDGAGLMQEELEKLRQGIERLYREATK